MPRLENGVGYRETDTSHNAAKSVKPQPLREQILDLLYEGDASTTEEIAKLLRRPYRSVQPRVSELAKEGLIIDTGERRIGEYGKEIIVWDYEVQLGF